MPNEIPKIKNINAELYVEKKTASAFDWKKMNK